MIEIISTVVVGLIVGAIARFLIPGENKMGLLLTGALGIAGSMLAGYVGQMLGLYKAGAGAGFIGSVIGAVLLLFVVGKFKGRASAGPDNKGPGGGTSA
jgi:uncharacterized membrane protein YeaQ/YmgE (transglycosylase-associated protein family)